MYIYIYMYIHIFAIYHQIPMSPQLSHFDHAHLRLAHRLLDPATLDHLCSEQVQLQTNSKTDQKHGGL